MTPKERAAMQQALEALEELHYSSGTVVAARKYESATAALREALADSVVKKSLTAQEQEPIRLQCTTCGTVYANGVPPQVKQAEQEPVAWHLDAETAKFLADMITADDEPTEITLRLGFIRDDDGKVQYGLLVEDSEYPEEGACLLVECEPPNAAPVSAKREWVDLTDDEAQKLWNDTSSIVPMWAHHLHFARAVISADREKNK